MIEIATIKIECCDLCGKAFQTQAGGEAGRFYGICPVLGLSATGRGWGRRENPIDFSGEVCRECFDEYLQIVTGFQKWLAARKGTKIPVVTIFDGTAGASVHEVINAKALPQS